MQYGYEFEERVKQTIETNTDLYAPLEITNYISPLISTKSSAKKIDASLTIKWQDKRSTFCVETKARSNPKMVQQVIWQLKKYLKNQENGILILPYLSKNIFEMCQEEKVSCLDLNGNYFIQTKELLAIRLDRPNAYKESQPIKKIFSGNSSIVGRFLLREKKTYSSVNEIYNGIKQLKTDLALSTVSKVLKGLEEDLIVGRSKDKIELLQPEKLLENLRLNYKPPKTLEAQKFKITEPIISFLQKSLKNTEWVLTGESSADRYATTTAKQQISAYVKSIPNLKQYSDDRFYTLQLIKTFEPFVYFDAAKRKEQWASKIQCYLELSQQDKREREIADNIKQEILKAFK